jgi:hypothetical protein
MDKIQWSDEALEKNLKTFLEKNNYTSPGNSVGPHTILNGLKNENANMILGVSRLKDFLHDFNQSGKLGSTQNKKYYLIIKK